MLLKKLLSMMKNKILSAIIATVLVLLCFLLPYMLRHKGSEPYDVLYFGDSIIAGWPGEPAIPEILAGKTGLKVYNGAFGGMTMSLSVEADRVSNPYTMVTMARLSESVRNRDFTLVSLASRQSSEKVVSYWSDRASGFKNIDLNKVKYVIIEQAANDYLADVTFDNPEDKYDISTFGGALRYSIKNIKKGLPDVGIIIESPIYTDFHSSYLGEEPAVSLEQYVALEKEISEEMGVCFFNAYELSGINETNASEYLHDGLHPNVTGSEMIVEALYEFINNME